MAPNPATAYALDVGSNSRWTNWTMKELKKKYKQDFANLQTHINEFDPCGLISGGAPVDEYDCLTDKILGLKSRGESKDKMRVLVLGELSDHFGVDFTSVKEDDKRRFDKALEKYLDNVLK